MTHNVQCGCRYHWRIWRSWRNEAKHRDRVRLTYVCIVNSLTLSRTDFTLFPFFTSFSFADLLNIGKKAVWRARHLSRRRRFIHVRLAQCPCLYSENLLTQFCYVYDSHYKRVIELKKTDRFHKKHTLFKRLWLDTGKYRPRCQITRACYRCTDFSSVVILFYYDKTADKYKSPTSNLC